MLKQTNPADSDARQRALDTNQSFVVSAPAGSGKTSLLVDRFLALLAKVEEPEEIVAITFTRKAASEMRERVITKIFDEDSTLAISIQDRDRKRNWNLRKQGHRLKIQTIDSFAAELLRSMPVQGSIIGTQLTDQPDILYKEAAELLIERLYDDDPLSDFILQFLYLCDNNADRAVRLLMNMLEKRDQWLPMAASLTLGVSKEPSKFRDSIQDSVGKLRETILTDVAGLFDLGEEASLQNVYSLLFDESGRNPDFHQILIELSAIFLTKQKTLRKSYSKNLHPNFAAREKKEAVLENIAQIEGSKLETVLRIVASLPSNDVNQETTELVKSIVFCLNLTCLHLQEVFEEKKQIDFPEILIRTKKALGADLAPTDLALYLDHQIRHLLVDEFQDTSQSQLEFFRQLTREWLAEEGRTIFVVGDPMQSIYAFRQTDVSIFEDLKTLGLSGINLEHVELFNNFRSQPAVVDFINNQFANLSTNLSIPKLGTVSFRPCSATADPLTKTIEFVRTERSETKSMEISGIINRIKEIRSTSKDDSIAILCQTRNHLEPLIQGLDKSSISWHGEDIYKLSDPPVISDLLAIHSILFNPEDRIAWFSLLRGPMVGLKLKELDQITGEESFGALISKAAQKFDIPERLMTSMSWFKNNLHELTTRELIEGTWIRLGGYDAYNKESLEQAISWFETLEIMGESGRDHEMMRRKTESLYAKSYDKTNLEILTIHRSKGLEYDHVCVPFLEQRPPPDLIPIMRSSNTNEGAIFGIKGDTVHSWLQFAEKQKLQEERKRLLYVACTRAKKSLYLSCTNANRNRHTGLSTFISDWEDRVDQVIEHKISAIKPRQFLSSLPRDYNWSPPASEAQTTQSKIAKTKESDISDRFEIALGNIVHKSLKWVADSEEKDLLEIRNRQLFWSNELLIDESSKSEVIELSHDHISTVLSSSIGRWILESHVNAKSEWELSIRENADEHRHIIIDRYFEFENEHWIIDYKTSVPTSIEKLDDFLRVQRTRYTTQLERYRSAIANLYPSSSGNIRTALYFTGIDVLQEL